MWEVVVRRCSAETLFWKFHKICREIPVLESLSKAAVVLKHFAKFTGKQLSCARVSFLIKLQASGLQLYWKRDSGTAVSCKFCKVSKDTFSYITPPVTASLSNTVKCVQAIRLATLLKTDPRICVLEPAICRSSRKYSWIIPKIHGKHLCCSLFLNKV